MVAIAQSSASRPAAAPNFISAGSQNAQGAQSPNAPATALDLPKSSQTAVAADSRAPALPLSTVSALPPRPGLGDDPIIPPGGFGSHEEAEKAFTHLLKKAGIDPTWTWDRTMRAIITDPLYKSLSTLAEKKAAWEKASIWRRLKVSDSQLKQGLQYVSGIKQKEKEERDSRLNKARPTFKGLLAGNPHVHHYSTFRTVDRLFSQHPAWISVKNEHERSILFEEHANELKAQELV